MTNPTTTNPLSIAPESIAPEQAKEWLARRNPHNRVLSQAHIETLVQDMLDERFLFNPADAICFDVLGNLMNGQHRLEACVQANRPFQAVVVRNCDPEAFGVMDANKRRSAADAAALMGLEDPRPMSAIARLLTRFNSIGPEKGWSKTSKVTTPAIQATLNRYGLEIKKALMFLKTLELPPGIALSRGAVCYLRFARQDEQRAKQLFKLIVDRSNLEEGSPIIALNKALEKQSKQNRRVSEWEPLGLLHKTWTAFRDGKKIKNLSIKRDESWWNIDGKVIPFEKEGTNT